MNDEAEEFVGDTAARKVQRGLFACQPLVISYYKLQQSIDLASKVVGEEGICLVFAIATVFFVKAKSYKPAGSKQAAAGYLFDYLLSP